MSTFFLDKKLKVYLKTSTQWWQIPVSSNPEFNQEAEIDEVKVSSLPQENGTQVSSTSSSKAFKTNLAPVSISFSTQMNPHQNNGNKSSEGILWEFFTGQNETEAGDLNNIFSLKPTYPTFDLYFIYDGARGYKVTGCVLTAAQVQISMSNVATVSWQGLGQTLSPTTWTPVTVQNASALNTSNQIINNLSTLSVDLPTGENSNPFSSAPNVPLISAEISLSVQHSPIRPDLLGHINSTVGFSRGDIVVQGNFSAYVEGTTAGTSKDFIEVIQEEASPLHSLSFNIGGTVADRSVTIKIDNAFIKNPSLATSSALTFSCEFIGTDSAAITNISNSSVARITYN